MIRGQKYKGFTIVELLIVIVAIAILAAISVAAYSGVQSRAKQSANQTAISQYVKVLQLIKADTGSLPSGKDANSSCLGPSPQSENCNIAGQAATASSTYTANTKTLLAQYGMTSQSAAGIAYSSGYLVYTSGFYGEPALLWQIPVDQDCVASPGRFVQNTNVWTDGVKYSGRSSYTTCYMSLNNL